MKLCSKKTLSITCLFSFLFITALFAYDKDAEAQPAHISDCIVTNSAQHLLLYFKVQNLFSEDITAGLQNGIPIVCSFTIELFQVIPKYPDKRILLLSFDHSLSFITLKEEYHAVLSEKSKTKLVFIEFNEAKKIVSEVNAMPLLPLEKLQPDTEYELQVRANISGNSLPNYFQYLLAWTNIWNVKTDWYTLKFRY